MTSETRIPEKIRRSALKNSLGEAKSSGASASIGELYAVPFAKEVGAQPLQIGLLTALSGVVAPLAQLWGTRLLEKGKDRKRVVLTFVFLQALMWIPIVILAIALHSGSLAKAGAPLFIFLHPVGIILCHRIGLCCE